MRKSTWSIILFIMGGSCLSEPDCYQLNNNHVAIYFRILGGGNDEVAFSKISSPETDYIFYSDSASSGSGLVALPLDPRSVETSFTFDGSNGINSLRLSYQRQVQFVSSDCGERYFFQTLSVIESNFDSVRVVSETPVPTPLPSSAKNIEIFRCPVTNQMGIVFTDSTVVEKISTDFTTIVVPSDVKLKRFVLPLNPDDSVTTYLFDIGNAAKTLRVSYKRTDKKIVELCDMQTFLSELHVNPLITDFASSKILSDSIHDLPIENIEITP